MDNLQWFKFSPANWFMGRIQRCSEITQARFIRLCCLYWNKECILSEEDAEIEVGEKELDEMLKLKIIDVENGMIHIKFLYNQFQECLELGNKRSEAAKARWNKQKKTKSMQMHNDELDGYADKSRVDETRGDKEEKIAFEVFWTAYDKKVGTKKANEKWDKLKPKEQTSIMEHVPKYVKATPDKKYRKDPCTYLNQRTWEDEELPLTGNEKEQKTYPEGYDEKHRPEEGYWKENWQGKKVWISYANL